MHVSRNGERLSFLEQHKLQGKLAWHLTPLLYLTQLKSVYTQCNRNSSINWCGLLSAIVVCRLGGLFGRFGESMAGPLSSSTLKVRLLNVLSFCNPSLRFRKTKSFFQLTSVSC